jgi:hypothetical protein
VAFRSGERSQGNAEPDMKLSCKKGGARNVCPAGLDFFSVAFRSQERPGDISPTA